MAVRIYNPQTRRMEVALDGSVPPKPTIVDMAEGLKDAVVDSARLAKAGKKVRASADVVAARKAICGECPWWDAKAYFGLGKCGLCGCTSGKLYLAASQCPENPPKWDKVRI